MNCKKKLKKRVILIFIFIGIIICKYLQCTNNTIATIIDEDTIEYEGDTYYRIGNYCSYVGKKLGTAKQKGDFLHPFVAGWFPNVVYKVYDIEYDDENEWIGIMGSMHITLYCKKNVLTKTGYTSLEEFREKEVARKVEDGEWFKKGKTTDIVIETLTESPQTEKFRVSSKGDFEFLEQLEQKEGRRQSYDDSKVKRYWLNYGYQGLPLYDFGTGTIVIDGDVWLYDKDYVYGEANQGVILNEEEIGRLKNIGLQGM